jgi:hypothetical protein
MLRSPPCPQGRAGVSKHEAAPSFERASLAPQGGASLFTMSATVLSFGQH